MNTIVIGVLAALPVLATLVLLARRRFEAMVGLRYLGRTRPPGRGIKVAVVAAVTAAVGGGAALFSGHAQGWVVFVCAALLLLGTFAALASIMLLRFSVFTTASVMGLALGVAALVVVMAVTAGFRREFLARVTAFHGHLVVGLYGEPSLAEAKSELATLAGKLGDLPGLIGTGPFAVSFAEVSIGPASASLKAIDTAAGPPPLARWMVAGDLANLTRPARCGGGAAAGPDFVGHIVLGRPLAARVRARVGDCIDVVVPFGRKLQPVALSFEVIGIFEMGFHQHDTRLAYVALDDLVQLEAARPFIYGLEMVFEDPLSVGRLAPLIEARVGTSYRVLDWRLLSQGLFAALETQRIGIGLFLSIIILVSAFNLVASLTIVVLTKTREIALLGALGARRASLLSIFVTAGGIAGLIGTGAGLLAGVGFCVLVRLYRFSLDASVYMITELPVALDVTDVLVVAGVAQVASLIATILPILRARRTTVTAGLRHV